MNLNLSKPLSSGYGRLLKVIGITMLIASLSAAQTLPAAGPKRPAAVPENYVITPFGYFHPSCVGHLADGDTIRRDQNAIQHKDGRYGEYLQVCAFPHFKADGESVMGDEHASNQPVISHAWVEQASVTTSTSSFGELIANWTVPQAPASHDGQTVFLFPGVEDYKDVVTIIQPVLGWNSDYSNAWGIASWNCCVSGTVYEAPPVRVNAGDQILGYMYQTCAAGTVSCATWNVVALDSTTGSFSQLINTSSHGQTFNWAFAGALEVYNIEQCSDYPANGTSFYNLVLTDPSFYIIANPAWSVGIGSGLTPSCSYGGTLSQQISLHY